MKKMIKDIIKKYTKSEKWILVDHYRLDSKWELIINNFSDKLLVIDDLADRNHNCDLLIDQNSFESRYDNLTPNNCKLLLGPKFAILGSEFLKMRNKMKQRNGSCKKFLISFGFDIKSYLQSSFSNAFETDKIFPIP